MSIPTPNRYKVIDVAIASGASLSGVIDLEWAHAIAIVMPAAWDTANLTLQAAATQTSTYNNVYDDGGTEVSINAAASRTIPLATAALKIAPLRFVKIRSGTAAAPVNQTADRTIKVICKV